MHRAYLNKARERVEKGKCTVVHLIEKGDQVLTGTRLVVETLTQWIRDAERRSHSP
jgi:hypothetical protein